MHDGSFMAIIPCSCPALCKPPCAVGFCVLRCSCSVDTSRCRYSYPAHLKTFGVPCPVRVGHELISAVPALVLDALCLLLALTAAADAAFSGILIQHLHVRFLLCTFLLLVAGRPSGQKNCLRRGLLRIRGNAKRFVLSFLCVSLQAHLLRCRYCCNALTGITHDVTAGKASGGAGRLEALASQKRGEQRNLLPL